MNNLKTLDNKIAHLEALLDFLSKKSDLEAKISYVSNLNDVKEFLLRDKVLAQFLKKSPPNETFAILSILAIGQGPVVFRGIDKIENADALLQNMLQHLVATEKFYNEIGGIIGYHLTVLKLIEEKKNSTSKMPEGVHFMHPVGFNIEKENNEVRKYTRQGIHALKLLAELYPVGGSGDRLHFHDESGLALPVAALPFCGKTLLQGLIEDLQAKEYVYYKIFGEQLETPIAMMTSHEKDNHIHIQELCESHQWFGRNPDTIRFFTQPLVPVITNQGNWVVDSPMHLSLKPGGHGVIWKQALDQGIFSWLIEGCQRRQALIRQINNPVAGIDYGLLAFVGIGSHEKKVFGFSSCPRKINTAEGMDILVENVVADGVNYTISNVEYTEFEKFGIRDAPEDLNSEISKYPANTNILFVDLEKIQPYIKKCSVPGMLINMKNEAKTINAEGVEEILPAGRLESTMQNISDQIVDHFQTKLNPVKPGDLKTFITFNQRNKTLSVTKKAREQGKSLVETPEGCFLELQSNYYLLLEQHCKITLPQNERSSSKNGPQVIVNLHPSIGPLYSIISQKISGGFIEKKSELNLQISEIEMKNIDLEGSLTVIADNIMGNRNEKGHLVYSQETGKCTLASVRVKNKGIAANDENEYFSLKYAKDEEMKIIIHGNGEFFAENVTFNGPQLIEVPDGHRMTAFMRGLSVHFHVEKIAAPTWYWKYSINQNDEIILNKEHPVLV